MVQVWYMVGIDTDNGIITYIISMTPSAHQAVFLSYIHILLRQSCQNRVKAIYYFNIAILYSIMYWIFRGGTRSYYYYYYYYRSSFS